MRKEHILSAARGLFQHYGFSKTTVADIAQEAGIGVGSVYLEFPSKGSIAAALTSNSRDAVLEAMQTAATASGGYSERLVNILEARHKGLRRIITTGAHGRDLVFADCSGSELANRDYDQREVDLLAHFLEQGNDAGAFTVAPCDLAARVLIRIFDTIAPAHAPLGSANKDELASLYAIVLGGLLARGLGTRS